MRQPACRAAGDPGKRSRDLPPGIGGGNSPVTLPLRVTQGGLLVTDAVTVNGKPVGPMVIDTGAGWTVLDRAAAKRLGVTNARPWHAWADGEPPDGFYRIASLDVVGGFGFREHVIAVADLSSISGAAGAGVIGGDVLGAMPFTIDYARGELTIHPRASFKPPAGVRARRLRVQRPWTRGSFIDANPAAGQPVVDGRIDGIPARVMLDTGCGVSLALRPWFVQKHPRLVDAAAPVVARVGGAAAPGGLAGAELRRANVREVELLGAQLQCVGTATALVAERPSPATGRHRSSAVLGYPFLMHGRLTFDYASGRMWADWRRE